LATWPHLILPFSERPTGDSVFFIGSGWFLGIPINWGSSEIHPNSNLQYAVIQHDVDLGKWKFCKQAVASFFGQIKSVNALQFAVGRPDAPGSPVRHNFFQSVFNPFWLYSHDMLDKMNLLDQFGFERLFTSGAIAYRKTFRIMSLTMFCFSQKKLSPLISSLNYWCWIFKRDKKIFIRKTINW